MQLRVCIVGEFSDGMDEGFKNIAENLSRELSEYHKVLRFDLSKLHRFNSWSMLKDFRPDIIHYIPGRTIGSFVLLKALSIFCRARTVMSAFHPDIVRVPQVVISLLKPDSVITQSAEIAERFRNAGCLVELIPSGVDAMRFQPCSSSETKMALRHKYRIDQDKFVILHAGHLIPDRNLNLLGLMQNGDNQVLIIASPYRRMDTRIYQALVDRGCIVRRGYISNVEEVFMLSDCYVFPVRSGCSLLMPLSVLEAMACNLPVISTRFNGLTEYFGQTKGLFFAKGEEDFLRALKLIKMGTSVDTRSAVALFSWGNMATNVSSIYAKIVDKMPI